jgi:hypothetical protein
MPHIRLPVLALALTIIAVAAFSMPHGRAHAAPAGQPCGGIAGTACDKGLWCEPAAGKCASPAGAQSGPQSGTCVAVPKLCIARKHGKNFQPVCGCNSKTYSSDCFRRAYRVAKFHDGKC